MKVGEKAKLTCPAATAYGSRAVGTIPANSDLTFEVELLGIVK
jgi:FKBP-type peptidyl-prolyl cis-trans isomerase FkpA